MLKMRTKYLLSIPIAVSTFLLDIIAVSADGLGGVDVSGGKVSIDVGKAGQISGGGTTVSDFFNKTFTIGRYIVAGVTGICSIGLVGVFAYKAFKVAMAGNSPKARQEAIQGMLYAGIGAALLGASSLLAGFAYQLFG